MPIIKSLLDNDTYCFTMAQAILECFPTSIVSYEFTDRNNTKYNNEFVKLLIDEIRHLCSLKFQPDELEYLSKLPWMKEYYLNYLRNFQFDIKQLTVSLEDTKLNIRINGPWHNTVYWETPLLALISECYFKTICKGWSNVGQIEKINSKSDKLAYNEVNLVEFGTRRRRSLETQEIVIQKLCSNKFFKGTSNLYFAKQYNLKPIGTVAHQWFMGTAGVMGIERANKFALLNWNKVYNGQLGIALTDTFTTDVFLRDFDSNLARMYDGVREDSGDSFKFINKFKNHYESLGINPKSKTFIPSNGLTTEKAIHIKSYHQDNIGGNNFIAAIGTHLTNDFYGSPPLNIVIKMKTINDKNVVKLSDDEGKETGDKDALRVVKYILFGTALDESKLIPPELSYSVEKQPENAVSKDLEEEKPNIETLRESIKSLHKEIYGNAHTKIIEFANILVELPTSLAGKRLWINKELYVQAHDLALKNLDNSKNKETSKFKKILEAIISAKKIIDDFYAEEKPEEKEYAKLREAMK